MFTELSQLLQHTGDTVSLTVSRAVPEPGGGAQLRVVILPRLHPRSESDADNRIELVAEHSGLSTPLVVTGTPAELDSPAFLEQIGNTCNYSQSVRSAR